MLTLSYGYKKPEPGDRGSVFFPALEDDIQRLNDHTHNGVNSAPISGSVITAGTVQALAANWVLVSTGIYRQAVTLPAGFTLSASNFSIRFNPSGHLVYPTIEKISNTQVYVYTCDNTLTYDLIFK